MNTAALRVMILGLWNEVSLSDRIVLDVRVKCTQECGQKQSCCGHSEESQELAEPSACPLRPDVY
jgi:hypothetical protein